MTQTLDNVLDVLPLTPVQLGMVYHTLTDPTAGVYTSQTRAVLEGDLDVDRFQAAWSEVIAAEPALRVAIVWDGLDEPLQVIRETVELPWDMRDLTDSDDAEHELERIVEEDRTTPFELTDAPLMRMTLVAMAPQRWEWIWTEYHALTDGWSADLLLQRVLATYRSGAAPSVASTEPLRTAIARRVASIDEDHWTTVLDGYEEPHRLEVPGLPPSDDRTAHSSVSVTIDAVTSEALRTAARNHNVTLNTVVLGAWLLVLSRWTRSDDVVTGVTVSGRNTTDEGIEEAIGLFINTLPLRATVDPSMTLSDWLPTIQRRVLDLQRHQHASLADVQRCSSITPPDPLFESIFVFENSMQMNGYDAGPSVDIGRISYIEQSNYPVAALAFPGDTITLEIVHDQRRISQAAAESVAAQISTVLDSFARSDGVPLGEVAIVAGDVSPAITNVETGPPLSGDLRPIVERVVDIASNDPDAPAVAFGGETITYAELLQRADAVASQIVTSIGSGHTIGLFVDRSIDMVVGILGIQRAGSAYVPLDPAYPQPHLDVLMDTGEVHSVVTTENLADRLPSRITPILIGSSPAEPADAAPLPMPSPDDLAYVIHTSGSTGRPKGVMVTHENLARSTAARDDHYGPGPGRFLLLSSFSFDSSIVGIFWTLASGGTLVLPLAGEEQDADAILGLAERERATHLLCLPALYRVLLDAAEGELASLEVAIVAGEACPPEILSAHLDVLPTTELHNEYGPTEASVWATAHKATVGDLGVPLSIGRPIAGTAVHVLDDNGLRVPEGFAGELCIAGASVTPGYLGRPDLTAERFVTVDIDGAPTRVYRTGDLGAYDLSGRVMYLGRTDHQLKIRGHRIEASAVESAIRAIGGVSDVAAGGYRTEGRSTDQLVAWIAADDATTDEDIAAALSDSLPAHMVPSSFIRVPTIPRLPNGKTDTRSLPAPGIDKADRTHVPPQTDDERTLADIWSDLLGLDEISIVDDFFALGGDSILTIQLISRARQAGVPLQPADVAANPTIQSLARAAHVQRDPSDGLSTDPVEGAAQLSAIQEWFFQQDFEVPDHWNQSTVFRAHHRVDTDALERALLHVAGHHELLGARFVSGGATRSIEVNRPTTVAVTIVEDAAGRAAAVEQAQSSLDLEAGPMLAAVVIRNADEGDELVIVVHHLVMDVVSWMVLAEDLATAYTAFSEGRSPELPSPTVPFGRWTSHLAELDVSDETAWWRAQSADVQLPSVGDDFGTEGDREIHTVAIAESVTELLLTSANEAYATRPTDVMVAALVETLAAWTGWDRVPVQFEGHGRPDTVDLTRTIGWFTAAYPVVFSPSGADSDTIKGTKEQLRAVPNDGLGYGVLRYVQRHPDLQDHPAPPVLFNYLGRLAQGDQATFALVGDENHLLRDPRNQRPYGLEVLAYVSAGRLTIEWQYARSRQDAATVADLARGYVETLERLVDHCMTADGGFTPSDFPEAGLDQSELDDLLEGL